MKRIILLFCAFLAFSFHGFSEEKNDTVTIFTIGDSTMADKDLSHENQERGWGQLLPLYFEGNVRISNHARNGRSTKRFIDEGRWDKVLSELRPGDYVIIQFGHNDEKSKRPELYTAPGSTFDENLMRFVRETREKGATPILMNPIVRRNFPAPDSTDVDVTDPRLPMWNVKTISEDEGEILVDTHGEYKEVPRRLAEENDVIFIDMTALTHDLVQGLGRESSKELFMWIPVGKYEFCPDGRIDNTHLNVLGALVVSRIAVNELAEKVPALRKYIKKSVYNLKH